MMYNKNSGLFYLALLITGLVARVIFACNLGSVDGDTAVYGLMAKHIYELKEFPVYMPLLHYAGSIASYIGAVLFAFFGVSSTVFNFVGVIFSFSWVLLTFLMAKELLDRFGVACVLILAILPYYAIFRYSLMTAQFGENMFFILLVLFVLARWIKTEGEKRRAMSIALGVCSGAALWTTPTAAPAILTVLTAVFLYRKKDPSGKTHFFFLAGFMIGYIPAIIYSFQYPLATMFRMGGMALGLDRSVLSMPDPAGIALQRIAWKISLVPHAAWNMPRLITSFIGVPSAALLIVSGILALNKYAVRKNESNELWKMLCVYMAWCVFVNIFLIQAKVNRYMIPLCAVYPLFIGYLLSGLRPRFRRTGIVLLLALFVYNSYTIIRSFPDKNTNRYSALAGRLMSRELHYGFSDYYTGYVTQFETKEKIIVSPTLFHPTFSDRWPEETKRVRRAPEVFYVVDTQQYPKIAPLIETACSQRGIRYRKESVEGFEIYYNFSSKVYPEYFPFQNAFKNG